MNTQEHGELLKEINETLLQYDEGKDAVQYIKDYNKYCHLIDDIIDSDENREQVLTAQALHLHMQANPFYQRYSVALRAVEIMVNNTYADSVKWEKSEEQWKRTHADVLRHRGYDMFFIVFYIVCGYEALRSVSSRFREFSHWKHLGDISPLPSVPRSSDSKVEQLRD